MAFSKNVAIAAAVAAATHLGPAAARADGALAVGTTGDVVKYGIAFGFAIDVPFVKAMELAIARCRTFRVRGEIQPAHYCKVVATFSRECYAMAYDPAPGTPGYGWGVGKDQTAADARAIAMCKETAGNDRQQYCVIERQGCDTRE